MKALQPFTLNLMGTVFRCQPAQCGHATSRDGLVMLSQAGKHPWKCDQDKTDAACPSKGAEGCKLNEAPANAA